ncbi:MAG: helix-turn-helix transcriptional regulator [Rhizobiaceae bacterium]
MWNSEEQVQNLTELEKRCLFALIDGKTSFELQEEVQLSGFTVQIIINALQKKMEVQNIAGLVSKVLRSNATHL